MTRGDDDLRIRPGSIRDGAPSPQRATCFFANVMRAARKEGHVDRRFGAAGRAGATDARGRFAPSAAGTSRSGRVVRFKARISRDGGAKLRSVALARHVLYLQRDGARAPGDAPADDAPGVSIDYEGHVD